QAVTEKIIDQQITKATKKEEKAESSSLTDSEKVSEKSNEEETANTKEKQNQQESSQLQSEKEINSKKTGFGSQALNHPAQATAVSNVGNEADNSGLEISEGKQPAAQKAGAEASTEPNYSEEEKNIKNYSDSERYKTTDLTPGSTIVENFKTDEGVEKDGFKFDTKNPSATSPSKTEYGYEIVIDKETGQRTYTSIFVTDSSRVPVNPGNKPMMEVGEKLTPESPAVTDKPNEDGEISGGAKQRQYNYEASEETLKHINSKDNDTTVIGMKDNYTEDNPQKKFFEGSSFAIIYKVNPWPNENDKLEELKLNTNKYDPKKKFFVQGQDIDTGVKVDNVDDNAKERLVGQVY
ncbi:MAG: adhesin domain containing protein, partial [Finegoldia magna]|nr:adhesin domain containing protein [Finegoldia magna]